MPKLNFSKLKSSPNGADSGSSSGKKQVSLSRFFSPAKPRQQKVATDDAAAASSRRASGGGRGTGPTVGPDDSGRRNEAERSGPLEVIIIKLKRLISPGETGKESFKRQKIQDESSCQLSSDTLKHLKHFQSPMHASTSTTKVSSKKTTDKSGGASKKTLSHTAPSPTSERGKRSRHNSDQKTTRPPPKRSSSKGYDKHDVEEEFETESIPSTSKASRSSTTQKTTKVRPFQKEKFQSKPDKQNASSSGRAEVSSKLSSTRPVSVKYTPLELQFIEIKRQHPDTLLFVECGYRYRFFGEDAEIAAKELNIFCHLDHNFMVASIPVYRLFVHTRRLVSKGHKVGVVKQTETAALKAAGENKGAPFERKLTALYTKSTLIGEDVDPVSGDPECEMSSAIAPTNYLLCFSEFTKPGKAKVKKDQLEFGLVAIQPATGDIIYDSFHDNSHLSELDTRLQHIQPVELLLPSLMSDKTEKFIRDMVSSSTTDDDRIRIERMENGHFEYTQALEIISAFYGEGDVASGSKEKAASGKLNQGRRLQEMINLPVPVICCLAALLAYLKEFQLHRVLKMASNLVSFSARSKFMKLDAYALRNLEIFKNQTDGSVKGSLLWVLNHTKTRFGGRLLRKWLATPLMSLGDIQTRQDAVKELIESDCEALTQAKDLLARLPDLEKGICSIYHKKCSSAEFYTVVKSLSKLAHTLGSLQQLAEDQIKSELLKTILSETPSLLEDVHVFFQAINEKAAKEGNKTSLFCDTSTYPGVVRCESDITKVLGQIHDHRKEIRRILRKPTLEYVTVSGLEFLIEVKNSLLKEAPNDWTKISSTKQVTRFHSPFIVKSFRKLSQLREQLTIECQKAWLQFLDSFGERYLAYRKAVQHLAALDCLFSLAELGRQDGYCRPIFCENGLSQVHIEGGRHPVVSTLLGEQEQYVPNGTHMEGVGERCMIITGPNMGGKSSYIRQVALITIMAQLGSWVPAESAKLGVLDAIYTRMGASDNIIQKRSTFMTELQEASDILSQATDRSLVILDELGRGTSTHDGVAIAFATAKYFIQEVKPLLLFVTHYPSLSELQRLFPDHVANYHMAFLLHENKKEKDQPSALDVITFLYQLVPGVAARSYGLNVARLAAVQDDIIKVAATKSRELEKIVMATRANKLSLKKLWGNSPKRIKAAIGDVEMSR
ncbi:DNA mismatch repair protein Msh3-like [Asterias rubens]|uniref:DNA mismatch repair protein Msh3-like n=1 Tax=Asterias rubens TaxID=7604 RepID=UPI0014552CDD|nr:DNA mismatch repair protein Msh3-like [Asterias rubens]